MEGHEQIARELKSRGNNCSASLNKAFEDNEKVSKDYPAPRSIDGKCGALLAAIKILKETGHENKIKEFEEEFEKRFKYLRCIDLMTYERRCSDYVGESAKILDNMLEKI